MLILNSYCLLLRCVMWSLSKSSSCSDSKVRSPSVPSNENVSSQHGLRVLLTTVDVCCLTPRKSTVHGSLLPFRSIALSPAALTSLTRTVPVSDEAGPPAAARRRLQST